MTGVLRDSTFDVAVAPHLSDQSLRGQCRSSLSALSARLPSGLPFALHLSPLSRDNEEREGFPDMSRFATYSREYAGQFSYPTRNFATLGPL